MSFPLPFVAIALSLCLSLSGSNHVCSLQNFVPGEAGQKNQTNTEEADAEAAQQRTIAISLVTTLADEARSFKDQTRRARVQARAADVLWDTEPDRARELFRRAWEAAEIVDTEAAKKRAEEMKRMETEGGPVVVRGGPELAQRSLAPGGKARSQTRRGVSQSSRRSRRESAD